MSDAKLEVITYKKRVLVDYDECETVLQLKNKLYMHEDIGVPPEQQRLYYFGNLLQDFKTLGTYNIHSEKYTLVLIHDLNHHHHERSACKTQHYEYSDSENNCSHKLRSLVATFAELKNYQSSSQTICTDAEYSTFDSYSDDPLFLNLVTAMNMPSDSVDAVELAVEKLLEKDHKVLDLIYEHLEEFLQLCSEPKKIGDANKKISSKS